MSVKKNVWKKVYIWNPVTCGCEHGKDAESIIVHSVIMCDQRTDTTNCILTKTVLGNFNEKKDNL